ncbi:MAG: family 20 glycosylhydrolase [Candidatus Hatepunaea meridiana]|nr:family 20 glycosylhydrolase [Candidatus Hatepunaea meridiana]
MSMTTDKKILFLPEPRKLQLTGGWINSALEPATISDDSFPNIEKYKLTISNHQDASKPAVIIESLSEKGLRNGLRTFAQLRQQYGKTLPCLVIEDYPSFSVRGVMLDISRDRVPTMKELFRIINLLASWKINHLQLYIEHTFAYKGHEVVWKDASPITPDEIRELDNHCLKQGITLAANQNCFGHMAQWLKHKPYAHLAETDGEWDFNGHPRLGSFSLCPGNPGSIDLIKGLLGQLLPNFSSNLVNIGCDETYDVGKGRSRGMIEKYGFAKVYTDYIKQVVEVAKQHNFQSMFWADIALSHPEALDLLPNNMIALAWGYEPDAPFERWGRLLNEKGFNFWVCPGTSSWRSITGRTFERKRNIKAAAKHGITADAKGFMITDWGDEGHRQQFPITLQGLAEGANAAWNAEASDRFDQHASSLFAFGDKSGEVVRWLDELGNADLELRRISGRLNIDGNPTPLRNSSCLFNDLHIPLNVSVRFKSSSLWQEVKGKLEDLAKRFPSVNDEQIADELRHTLDVAQFATDRAVFRRISNKLSHKTYSNLAARLCEIIDEHIRLWLLRSRPGGLGDSCGYYESVLDSDSREGRTFSSATPD